MYIPTQPMELVDIPVADIKVLNRLRKTDPHKIGELAESIRDINLLHPIAVAEKDDHYVLLSGEHRLSAFKLLERPTIPCVCLLYTSPSPRDLRGSPMPTSA